MCRIFLEPLAPAEAFNRIGDNRTVRTFCQIMFANTAMIAVRMAAPIMNRSMREFRHRALLITRVQTPFEFATGRRGLFSFADAGVFGMDLGAHLGLFRR